MRRNASIFASTVTLTGGSISTIACLLLSSCKEQQRGRAENSRDHKARKGEGTLEKAQLCHGQEKRRLGA